jgi:hypothetical protein
MDNFCVGFGVDAEFATGLQTCGTYAYAHAYHYLP